ncbi:MAG: NTP transferase domain-containing protein [Candidatus Lokiarchaeota archaeon]|nr:NTP transferase domain-containing protein [Candidatus Lokiarchaeota archaeon]
MIDSAVILAAGLGTRLMPLTKTVPKPLLDVAGIPMIARILGHMNEAGIEDFIIVIRPEHEAIFKKAIPGAFKARFVYQVKATGMADAILAARKEVHGDFVVCAGDMIVPEDHIVDVLKVHGGSRPFATLSLFKAGIEYVKGLGNVRLDGEGRVTEIVEKPTRESLLSNVYSLPFYAFNEELFAYLDRCPVSSRGERELQDAIQLAIRDGKAIRGVPIQREFSKDEVRFRREIASLNISDLQDYFYACMSAVAEAGVQVPQEVLCTLIEPVRIGAGCQVSDNALIGPGAILGDGVGIGALAEVSNAILLTGCKVGKNCLVDHAIVSIGATVEDGATVKGSPTGIKLVE